MARIAKEAVNQVVQATDLVTLISGYVLLKKTGKNFLGLCPFHQERSPSFNVSPTRQSYHCFGCGAHGDAIRFVMEMEHVAFIDAVKSLADKAGIPLGLVEDDAGLAALNELERVLELAQQFFHQNLRNAGPNSQVRAYLAKRKLAPGQVDAFGLGYVGQGWTQLLDFATQQRVKEELLLAAGLVKEGEKGGLYDRLRNRLIFPIRDASARIIGFAGRDLGDEGPKYLNPPETDLYKKSVTFYGIDKARDEIRKSGRALVVEGYLDVIRLHEQGWKEAVAACGTALNDDHVQALRRLGVKEAILLFDGDQAGQKAAEKSARLLLEKGMDSRVLVLPGGQDPDEYLQSHSNADFAQALEQALPDWEFLTGLTKARMEGQGLQVQQGLADELIKLAKGLGSPVKQDLMLAKVAASLGLERSTLQAVRPQPEPTRQLPQGPANQGEGLLSQHPEEANLIAFLLAQPQGVKPAMEWASADDFDHAGLQRLFIRLVGLEQERLLGRMEGNQFADVFSDQANLVNELLQQTPERDLSGFTKDKLNRLLVRLKKKTRMRLQEAMQLAQARGQDKEIQRLSKQSQEIRLLLQRLDDRNPKPAKRG